ncbi:unnamed protein product [Sordaria macrospora k-hell]|uniref:WGS project CABT00000000 data, contig 2.75 n=2 Tax=Sordaria macrospora TaxID=5147 RepID=F7WBG0_SORMK|nr:uncharacterized protein SMAC_09182 [Sordaria macrospora k-hell]KAH7625235.1 hypothetical protein B0T09DRAFT_388051 [Sordaria sp. MPI-SDFR-AT-0083]CCC05432.1 unnamed protein product [Sordaria macrospora k-hell]
MSTAKMVHDLDTILRQIPKGSSLADKAHATGRPAKAGHEYHKVGRSDDKKTSNAEGMTPMGRFQAEGFGDTPWHNVKDVYIPKK